MAAAGREDRRRRRGCRGRFHAYATDRRTRLGPDLLGREALRDRGRARDALDASRHLRGRRHDRPADPLRRAARARRQAGAGTARSTSAPRARAGLRRPSCTTRPAVRPRPARSASTSATRTPTRTRDPGALPADRDTALPEPTLTVGPGSFTTIGNRVRATVLHELEHVNHAKLANAAVRRWRATTKAGSFDSWLARENKAGRVGVVEDSLIGEEVSGGTKNTESLSYLVASWRATTQVDLAKTRSTTWSREDSSSEARAARGRVGRRPTTSSQEQVVAHCSTYRDTLGEPHRPRLCATPSAGTRRARGSDYRRSEGR